MPAVGPTLSWSFYKNNILFLKLIRMFDFRVRNWSITARSPGKIFFSNCGKSGRFVIIAIIELRVKY
jgi:hypothetical protein